MASRIAGVNESSSNERTMSRTPFRDFLALSTRARCRARAGANRVGLLDLPDVGCLKTLWTASYFELDPVTFSKAFETLGLDGAVVDEYVLSALLCDEPITLCIVEPLHLSLSHTSDLSLGGLQAPVLPPSWRGCLPGLAGKQKNPPTQPPAAGGRSTPHRDQAHGRRG